MSTANTPTAANSADPFDALLSERIKATPSSFIRDILKVANDPSVISFAGGLPNPASFPQDELVASMAHVVAQKGAAVFQYAATAGIPELRAWAAERYTRLCGTTFSPDDVLVTTGSQQALDLLGKALLNEGDAVLVEEPAYLGALQAFTQYGPRFCPVPLRDDGLDPDALERTVAAQKPKLAYLVPNFQNPTGLTYSAQNRARVRAAFEGRPMVLVEDDPYGDLRFEGERLPYIGADERGCLPGSVILGTLSKTMSPGMRIGFLVTKNAALMEAVQVAKQASDLHTSALAQYLAWDYLTRNDHETHVARVCELYRGQAQAMVDALERHFPSSVRFTRPQGGMFVWATLPEGCQALDLFPRALERGVAFVPGDPFYTDGRHANTMRLNFTNADAATIEEGVRRLGELLRAEL